MINYNNQPIYTRTTFLRSKRLIEEVAGRKLTTENVVELITFPEQGGLVWNITATPLGNNPDGLLFIYGKHPSVTLQSEYTLLFELGLPVVEGVNSYSPLPNEEVILPRIYNRDTTESRGLVVEGGYALFCALSKPMTSGWDVRINGGFYG